MQNAKPSDRFAVVQNRMSQTSMTVFVDVLLGVDVKKLPQLSKSALQPSRHVKDALCVIAKDAKSTSKRDSHFLKLRGSEGDCVRWQITSIGEGQEYKVDIYNVSTLGDTSALSMARTESIDVCKAESAVVNEEQDTIEYNAGINKVYHYFKNYILKTDVEAVPCEVWFKVSSRKDNSLIGYGCWSPQVELIRHQTY